MVVVRRSMSSENPSVPIKVTGRSFSRIELTIALEISIIETFDKDFWMKIIDEMEKLSPSSVLLRF